MKVSRADPARIDARAVGFRLAPRINAAGRLERADAGLELLLTTDDERAGADRRRARSPQRRAPPHRDADPLRGRGAGRAARRARRVRARGRGLAQGRHRDRRVADRRAPPPPGGADRAAGAGRAGVAGGDGAAARGPAARPAARILAGRAGGEDPAGRGRRRGFLCARHRLGPLDPRLRPARRPRRVREHLVRHGGHRAAAGCEILASEVDAFRAAFEAHAAATLRPEDLVPSERADAVVAGDELGLALAEELELLAPFGIGNPGVSLLLPAARFSDPRTMGEGKHARFSVEAGGMRAGAVAFGVVEGRLRRPARRDLLARAQRVQRRRRAAARAAQRAPVRARADHDRGRAGGLPRRRARRARAPARPRRSAAAARRMRCRGARAARTLRGGARPAPRLSRPPRRRDRRHDRRARRLRRAGARRRRRRDPARAPPRSRSSAASTLCSHEALERDPRLAARTRTSSCSTRPPARRASTASSPTWHGVPLSYASQSRFMSGSTTFVLRSP